MTSSRRGPSSVPSRTQCPALTGAVQPTTARASTSSVTSQSRLSSVWMSTPTPCVPRRLEQPGQLGERVGCQVRRAADEVDARGERGLVVLGRGQVAAERHQLEVEQAAQLLAHPDQGVHAAQRVGPGQQVDVAADRGRAVREHRQRLGPGAVRDLVDRHLVRVRVPRLDREPQVAHRRPDRVPGERLVEVGVRVGRRRQQQEAVELEGRVRVAGTEGAARRRPPRRCPSSSRTSTTRPSARRACSEPLDGAGETVGHERDRGPPSGSAWLTRAGAPSRGSISTAGYAR